MSGMSRGYVGIRTQIAEALGIDTVELRRWMRANGAEIANYTMQTGPRAPLGPSTFDAPHYKIPAEALGTE